MQASRAVGRWSLGAAAIACALSASTWSWSASSRATASRSLCAALCSRRRSVCSSSSAACCRDDICRWRRETSARSSGRATSRAPVTQPRASEREVLREREREREHTSRQGESRDGHRGGPGHRGRASYVHVRGRRGGACGACDVQRCMRRGRVPPRLRACRKEPRLHRAAPAAAAPAPRDAGRAPCDAPRAQTPPPSRRRHGRDPATSGRERGRQIMGASRVEGLVARAGSARAEQDAWARGRREPARVSRGASGE